MHYEHVKYNTHNSMKVIMHISSYYFRHMFSSIITHLILIIMLIVIHETMHVCDNYEYCILFPQIIMYFKNYNYILHFDFFLFLKDCKTGTKLIIKLILFFESN